MGQQFPGGQGFLLYVISPGYVLSRFDETSTRCQKSLRFSSPWEGRRGGTGPSLRKLPLPQRSARIYYKRNVHENLWYSSSHRETWVSQKEERRRGV